MKILAFFIGLIFYSALLRRKKRELSCKGCVAHMAMLNHLCLASSLSWRLLVWT